MTAEGLELTRGLKLLFTLTDRLAFVLCKPPRAVRGSGKLRILRVDRDRPVWEVTAAYEDYRFPPGKEKRGNCEKDASLRR